MELPNIQPTPAGPTVAQVLQPTPQAVPQAPPGNIDPVFQGLAWVAGILLAVLGMAKPFMGLIRQYKVDKTDSAKEAADAAIFERQTKLLDKLNADVERLMVERNVWFEEATALRSRVEKLEEYERSMAKMKEKLDEKDLVIAELRLKIGERDAKIMDLMTELMKTNDRLHELEARLARDERTRVFSAQHLPPIETE